MARATGSFRKRVADWPPLTTAIGTPLAWWLRLVQATGRWHYDGFDAVKSALETHGAVIMVIWHERSMGSVFCFDTKSAPGLSLHAESRAGRLAGVILRHFGYQTQAFHRRKQSSQVLRTVLTALRGGTSIGLAADGPQGPARVAKTAPIQWARATGKPIFVLGFSARHAVHIPSWDRTMIPMPFSRVTMLWRPWAADLPKRMDTDTEARLAADLSAALDRVTEEADIVVGRRSAPR